MPASQAALREVRALAVRPRSVIDKTAGHTGTALGLGPAPAPGSDRNARRFGLGLFGTMASIIWMWSLTPPPF
ncbi:hypothetical protein [Sandarakinorhabdus sp.]|uniref:hypothetical protein n=1 Tax=Sandarakinorhabdus sp. TaxID=1916663 RepID=UPI003563CA71